LIEAYEPQGAIALSNEYPAEFLECLLFQTVEHRMSDEDRAKRQAEETLKDQKADLLKRELRISIAGEQMPRILSMASFFPDANTGENGDQT
jgi:hypothetical protein